MAQNLRTRKFAQERERERITTHPTRKVDLGPDLQPGRSRPGIKRVGNDVGVQCMRAGTAAGAWWRQRQRSRENHEREVLPSSTQQRLRMLEPHATLTRTTCVNACVCSMYRPANCQRESTDYIHSLSTHSHRQQ